MTVNDLLVARLAAEVRAGERFTAGAVNLARERGVIEITNGRVRWP